MSGSGEVRAATFGSATITARYQGVSGSQDVAVRCGVALSILPSGPLQIARGTTVKLQTFGNFVTPLFQQVDGTFSSSRAEIAPVARVPQTNDWQLTALAPGQATIHATYQCGAADLEVSVF